MNDLPIVPPHKKWNNQLNVLERIKTTISIQQQQKKKKKKKKKKNEVAIRLIKYEHLQPKMVASRLHQSNSI